MRAVGILLVLLHLRIGKYPIMAYVNSIPQKLRDCQLYITIVSIDIFIMAHWRSHMRFTLHEHAGIRSILLADSMDQRTPSSLGKE